MTGNSDFGYPCLVDERQEKGPRSLLEWERGMPAELGDLTSDIFKAIRMV
jgi:hypothetical protein